MSDEQKQLIIERYKKEIVSRAVEISPHGVLALRDFILNEIDLAIKQTEERIVGEIEEYPKRLMEIMPEGKLHFVIFEGRAGEDEKKIIYFQAIKDIINLIRNK